MRERPDLIAILITWGKTLSDHLVKCIFDSDLPYMIPIRIEPYIYLVQLLLQFTHHCVIVEGIVEGNHTSL